MPIKTAVAAFGSGMQPVSDRSEVPTRRNVPGAKPASALPSYSSTDAALEDLRPSEAVFCIRPDELRRAAQSFGVFPGRVLYAVKCNPHPFVLRALFDAGVRDFDVASLDEIQLVNGLFGKAAGQFFNNPAKSRKALRSASEEHGIRFYTVDCEEEIEKVLEEVHGDDVMIAVRLATPAREARYVLSTKFGAPPVEAARLLQIVHRRGLKAGLTFHVGSQCLAPKAFSNALSIVGKVLDRAGVPISVLNVGGGFPASYPGDRCPGLETYFSHIIHGRRRLNLPSGCMLLCEPGTEPCRHRRNLACASGHAPRSRALPQRRGVRDPPGTRPPEGTATRSPHAPGRPAFRALRRVQDLRPDLRLQRRSRRAFSLPEDTHEATGSRSA
jgi:hypothetical protein